MKPRHHVALVLLGVLFALPSVYRLTRAPTPIAELPPCAILCGELLDLNTATEGELTMLPGVGASTARAIVEARPFSSVEDVLRARGVGPAKLAAMRDLLSPIRTPRAESAPPAPHTSRRPPR